MDSLTIYPPGYSGPLDYKEGGLLLVDKPLNWTSFDVVNKLRYRLSKLAGVKRLKVGHAGTLDPKATGLLLICFGKHTGRIEGLMGHDKTYTGTFTLGATTPSYDTETEPDMFFETAHITAERIEAARKSFLGPQQQMPPIFSAIKVGGKPVYKSARAGREVTLEARPIDIRDFEVMQRPDDPTALDFEVRCTKGTYIRSLAYDFGQALESGAYLSALRRTAIGDFRIEQAWQIDDFLKSLEG